MGKTLRVVGGLFVLTLASQAWGETFVFRDKRQGKVRGKVLVEFDDTLFVAVDGQGTRFIPRAELKAIVDETGQSHESPRVGTFGRVGGPTPAAAITDVVGEVWTRAKLEDKGTPVRTTPSFVKAGHQVVTGTSGMARLVLPSGTTIKQAPAGETAFRVLRRGARLQLLRGEVLLKTQVVSTSLGLDQRVVAKVDGGAQVTAKRRDTTTHLLQHRGRTRVAWPQASFGLNAGLGVELVRLGGGRWRVTADRANADEISLRLRATTVTLKAGASRVVGGLAALAPDAPTQTWRLQSSVGDLLMRRGPKGRFLLARKAERDRLVVGPGDAVRTLAKARATFKRSDGATLTLQGLSRLEVARILSLQWGRLTLECLKAPVFVATPAGPAELHDTILQVSRPLPIVQGTLELEAVGGTPAIVPLGVPAELTLERRAKVRVATKAHTSTVHVLAGRAQVDSRPVVGWGDPGFKVPLTKGQQLGVRAGERPALLLPDKRVLEFATVNVQATVSLAPRVVCVFPSRSRTFLKAGLQLALAREQGFPQLRFKSGPRLLLRAPFAMRVENPTVVLEVPDGKGATVELEDEVQASLLAGGRYSAAALGVRVQDRLEVPAGGKAKLDLKGGLLRFSLGSRRLLIHEEAPAVQARFGDAAGNLFLTMPGTPALGLAPQAALTVLASKDGEFVVLDRDKPNLSKVAAQGGIGLLSGESSSGPRETIARDRIPDLLDVPRPASPSGP